MVLIGAIVVVSHGLCKLFVFFFFNAYEVVVDDDIK
jgi:hypothetical protein